MNIRRTQTADPRGQVLIIVAVSLIVLIAIAAIVVDLGFSWMLRRQEQNAADPASLAAARFISDPDPVTHCKPTTQGTAGWRRATTRVPTDSLRPATRHVQRSQMARAWSLIGRPRVR